MDRPGMSLLESMIYEEQRGRPGPAFDAALNTPPVSPAPLQENRLDAVSACLMAGEARRALRLMQEVENNAASQRVTTRVRALRAWAEALDRNWYPGNTGAEIDEPVSRAISHIEAATSTDPEVRMLEACVAHGPVSLLSARSLFLSTLTRAPQAAGQLLAVSIRQLETFQQVASETGHPRYGVWANIAAADLLRRTGHPEPALQLLRQARQMYEETGDHAGTACCCLVEGDWWATPRSSPEALGFVLEAAGMQEEAAPAGNGEQASVRYDQAATLLARAGQPRLDGALALRRAVLAWQRKDWDVQLEWLSKAGAAFAAAGDRAAAQLVTVHRLIADVSRGEAAAVRRAAGAGWDLAARGPVAELLAWGREDGSISFVAGLGRLFQRAAQMWETADAERAATLYTMAVPLVPSSDVMSEAVILNRLGTLDAMRHQTVRALVRYEQALSRLPVVGCLENPVRWMEHVDLVTSIMNAQTQATGSSRSGDALLRGLKRSCERLRDLLSSPGAPQQDAVANLLVDSRRFLAELGKAHETHSLEELLEQAREKLPSTEARMLAAAAQGARDSLNLASILWEMEQAKLAERRGYPAAALFEEVRQSAARGNSPWLEVLVLLAADRLEEGKRRFADLYRAGVLPADMAGVMALRLGEYEMAGRIFAQIDGTEPARPLSWSDYGDRAEAALGAGESSRALASGRDGIRVLEAEFGNMRRDSERIAASDDIRAASLYSVAARAWLALETTEPNADSAALRLIDRARSLAFAGLIALFNDPAGAERERQRAAAEWSSAFDRLLAAHNSAPNTVETCLHDLEDTETKLLELEAGTESKTIPAATAPASTFADLDVAALQRALPADACVLEYHVVGRDLIGCCVSRSHVKGRYLRLPSRIEGSVSRLLAACRNGNAGNEAGELAERILDPFARELADCARLIVVPFGALNAVPFHALPLRGALLGENRVLSYVPAAAILLRHPLDRAIEGSVLAVGDPAFDQVTHPHLRRLPGASIEARAIANLYGSADVITDGNATEEKVRGLLAGRAIAHLAAHGRLDDVAPSMSSVILAGNDQLTVADLLGMEVDTRLVILSACDTGRGAVTMGGDVVGLARGLFAAGVWGCVVSLWPVDDAAACVTMYEFHKRLANHEPAAAALAHVQQDLRALPAAGLAAKYEALGGKYASGDRSVRRGERRPRSIPLDPEFLDTDADEDVEAAGLDGSLTRVWAPFILIGC
jgi:CHAT domain-containing protein